MAHFPKALASHRNRSPIGDGLWPSICWPLPSIAGHAGAGSCLRAGWSHRQTAKAEGRLPAPDEHATALPGHDVGVSRGNGGRGACVPVRPADYRPLESPGTAGHDKIRIDPSTSGPDRPGAARAADFSCAVVRADEGARTYPTHPCPGSGSRRRRAAPPPPWYWSRRPKTPRRGRSLPVPERLVRVPAGAWAPRPGRPVSLAPRLVAGAGRWPIRGPRPAPPPSPEAVPGPGTPGPRPRRNPRGGSRPVAWPARPGWGRPASFLPPRAAPRPGPARRRRSPVPTTAQRGTGSC